MAQAKEMLDELKDQAPEADPFPTIRESLAELGANPEKYEKILAKTDEKLHWEKVFNPKTTLEAGAITLLAAAKQSGAEPEEYLSRLAPYFDSRIQSLPGLYTVAGYVSGDNPTRAVMTRTARAIKSSGYTLPHELEHTLQNVDFDNRGSENIDKVSVPGRPDPVLRFGGFDSLKGDLQKRLAELPEEERNVIAASHPVFGRYLSRGNELFARIRAKDMVDSAKGEDFLQTDLGQKLFPTDRDRSYFIGSTLPGVPTITPPYTFESTDKNRKPLTDPKTSYARQLYNKLTAPKEFAEGGEVTEFPEEQASPTQQDLSEAAKRLLYYKKTASPKLPPGVIPDTGQLDGVYQAPTVTSETSRVFGMQPREDRLSILPRYVPGQGLVAPEMLYDVARAIAAPRAAAQGYEVAPEEALNLAMNVAGGATGASAGMRRPTGEGGVDLGMFVGQKSNTWDMDKYERALQMQKEGIDPAEINRMTGYWQNPSSKIWSQEISDYTARITDGLPKTTKDSAPLSDVIQHKPLFYAYPDLKNVIVKREKGENATFDPRINTLLLGEDIKDPKTQLSIILHEVQHWIQTKENFPRGSSPEEIAKIETPEMAKISARMGELWATDRKSPEAKKEFNELLTRLNTLKKLRQQNAFGMYQRAEGEAQARATQERMWMDRATRRELTPLGNFDVPVTELIQMGQFGELAPTSRVPGAPVKIK